MDWIRKVNPKTRSVEDWMRETKYTGDFTTALLKNVETLGAYYAGLMVNREKVLALVN